MDVTNSIPHELDTQLGKGWEQKMYDVYFQGGSDAEVARLLRITMALFDKFYQGYPIFEEVVNKGRSDAKGFWENLGRTKILKANGDLNDRLWFLVMKNRFGWMDKLPEDGSTTPAAAMTADELDQKLAKLQKKALPALSTRAGD